MNHSSYILAEGARIARTMKETLQGDIRRLVTKPSLGVLVCSQDLATEKFITLKQKNAGYLGVALELYRLPSTITTDELVSTLAKAIRKHHGIIVQFPLPHQVDGDTVRNAIPWAWDVDLISDTAFLMFKDGKTHLLPPVVGALAAILKEYRVPLKGKRVVIVGEGRLVGIPAKVWAEREGAEVVTVNARTENMAELTKSAEVLILGAGVPGLITPEMVTEGVVVLDAGTSEAAGKLAGDADPGVAQKAALFTPVPGGVGPITIAVLFENLVALSQMMRR
jgi:methylenetetrahydrofolate dehydrogenase (NADP+)/methenyltetrahydrofolate cyclohydrolase